jgi:hypothetical protein
MTGSHASSSDSILPDQEVVYGSTRRHRWRIAITLHLVGGTVVITDRGSKRTRYLVRKGEFPDVLSFLRVHPNPRNDDGCTIRRFNVSLSKWGR